METSKPPNPWSNHCNTSLQHHANLLVKIRLTICVYQPNKYNIVGKHANKSCAGVSSLNLQYNATLYDITKQGSQMVATRQHINVAWASNDKSRIPLLVYPS